MMKDIYFFEIRKRIDEIRNLEQNIISENELSPTATEITANKNMLIDTVEKLVWLSNMARREGLLALESAAYEMEGFPGVKYLKIMVLLVCDGTFQEDLEESLYCRYFSAPLSDYAALQYLLMMYGIMAMQAGKNPRLIEETLLYILPEELTDEYERRQEERNESDELQAITDLDMSKVDALCSEDIETCVNTGDEYYYVVKMLEEVLSQVDDQAVQRILRDVDNADLECAMKVMSGKTRRILFNNLPRRLAVMVAEDYEFMGTVRLFDACEACRKIFMVFLKLSESGEVVYSEELIFREMATLFLSKKDPETKAAIKESENKLYKLWKEYLHHSNRQVGERRNRD
ncbi:MAG: hypothetical protein K6E62_11490 [Lachnospiraceae bacterium]|nr:hypothetical protein [Lachnospiraceae bacterium]